MTSSSVRSGPQFQPWRTTGLWRIIRRVRVFRFLEEQTARHGEVLDWQLLTKGFSLDGSSGPFVGRLGHLEAGGALVPISVTTAPSRPGRPPPNKDEVDGDGLLRYRYQGTDPNNHFNAGLRELFRRHLPLIYFVGIDKGHYRPFWPSFIVQDDPEALTVYIELHDAASSGIDLRATSLGEEEEGWTASTPAA